MKKKLFSFLPNWLKKNKYADKIAHAIYGTLFYLLVSLFLYNELALFVTFCLAIGIELYDKYEGGKSDFVDFLATIFIPCIIFIYKLLHL